MSEYNQVVIESEFEDEDGSTFWWGRCIKDKCANQICLRLSDRYCYPHSKWYRPITAKVNYIITILRGRR